MHPGDRVSIEPGVPCHGCEHCQAGRYNLCPDVVFMATPPVHGAFAEYVAHPASRCFKIPDGMSYDAAALIEPLSVGLYAVERGRAVLGDRAVILGAGPIGLVTLLSLKSQGIDAVTVVDVVDFRLEKARELGAERIGRCPRGRRRLRAGRQLRRGLRNRRRAGHGGAIDWPGRPGRRVVLVGLSPDDTAPIDTNHIIDKGLDVAGVFRYAHTWPKAIELVASGRVDLEPLVSAHYPLDNVQEAMDFARLRKDACIKVMVEP